MSEAPTTWHERTWPDGFGLAGRGRELKQRLAEAQNWRCPCCGVRMTMGCGPRQATFEHIVPRRVGGRDHIDNLAITCITCNKADRAWKMWVALCMAESQFPAFGGLPILPQELGQMETGL